jgi:hypothetical protein
MEKDYLILKSAPASRPGEWSDDDYDVLSDGSYVGRIFKAAASPVGTPWMWTILVIENRENYMLTHGYAASREGLWPHSPRVGGGTDSLVRLCDLIPIDGPGRSSH